MCFLCLITIGKISVKYIVPNSSDEPLKAFEDYKQTDLL